MIDSNLFQKPIIWGKEKSHYIVVDNGKITINSHNISIPLFIQALGELFTTSNQQFQENLNSKSVTELKIFYFNVENILNKAICYYNRPIRKIYYELWLQKENPTNELKQLSNIVFEVINSKESWIRPVLEYSVPHKIQAVSNSLENSKGVSTVYRKYIYKRNYYKDNYCIAIHAQSTYLNLFCDLVKEIQKAHSPEINHQQFQFLRDPTRLTPYVNLQDFLKKEYKPGFDDHTYSKDLIAADLFDESIAPDESAYDFFKSNQNATEPIKLLDKTLEEIFISLSPSQIERIEEKKRSFIELIKNNRSTANLVMICIPKTFAYSPNSPMWLSRPHGYQYRLKLGSSFKDVAECLMNRQLDEAVKHIKNYCAAIDPIPQVRILANQLTSENGVKSFRFNDLSMFVKKECREIVKSIVDIMHESVAE